MFLARLLVAAVLAMSSCALAQGISYTVQVVALSDQESALNVQRTLLDDAFPAYVVRASVAQGDIYRVRVGSFANRLAALEYARAMPNVAGSRPLPALAEGIPDGIMPVQPRLLLAYVPETREPDGDQEAAEEAVVEPDDEEEMEAGRDADPGDADPGDADPDAPVPAAGDAASDAADAGAGEPDTNSDETGPGVSDTEAEAGSDAAAVDIEVVAWADTFALRIQPRPERPATFVVPTVAGARTFEAWRAAPAEAGILRVRNLMLWPAHWQEQSVEAREEHRLELIDWVARRVGAAPAEIEPLQRRPVFGPPYLVVLELTGDGDGEATVLGVTDPAGEPTGYGPDVLSVGEGQYPEANEPLFVVSPDTSGPDDGVAGEGWSVTPDERFFQVVTAPGESSWRAGLGRPLWAAGNHLLTRDADRLLLYQFVADE